MSAKGGITEGKSHKEGGIPMEVKSTGQKVELEGGEAVINKRNMASTKKFEFEGKEKTICEIASEINSADGNGVQIDCNNITGKKYEYAKGGKILDEYQEDSFKEWMDDGNVIEFEKGVYSTQDAQYSNKLKGMDELRKYFKKEFLSDSYEGGGNIAWSKAKIGDSARVKSENKMGLIMKDYGRKFHLRFADDTEKTYDASELDFYRFDDEDDSLYAGGGEVSNLGHYTAIANLGIRKIKENLDNVQEVQEFMTRMAEKNAISVELTKINQEGKKQTILYEFDGQDCIIKNKSGIYEKGGDVRDFDWYQMWKKDQVKKGTEHELEHKDTIDKFKKEGVSDREVAKAIAEDHLDEDENYYIELSEMEKESKKVGDTLADYEKQKSHRKNSHKYSNGGRMGDAKVKVHLLFTEDFTGILRKPSGKYITESVFPKGKVFTFNFMHNDGRTTALEFANTGAYMLVPSEIINVIGFDEKFANGGSVSPYQSISLDENDKRILKVLRLIDNIYDVTSKEKQFLSTFKGENLVNQLSNSLIQKIFGILFKYHNVEHSIKRLYLSNIGVGNILSFAPTYLEHTYYSFDEKNNFSETEKEISSILNYGKSRTSLVESSEDLKNMDGIIHVYADSNPKFDELTSVLLKSERNGCVALGVAEFTTREKLNQFQKTISQNQGGMSQNQMMMFKKANDYLIVNEGITEEGNYTLIYVMNKM